MAERVDKIEKLRFLLRSINRRMEHYFTVYLQQYDITLPQFLLLREVYRNPNLSLTELSPKLGLANSTVCGIVDRLEKRELVSRTRDTNDRRVVRISLTPKMLTKVKDFQLSHATYLMQFTVNISDAEIEQMISSLSLLQQELEREDV